MKKNILFLVLFLLLNACSIKVSEKNIFSASAYKTKDIAAYFEKNMEMSDSEKADMQSDIGKSCCIFIIHNSQKTFKEFKIFVGLTKKQVK